MRIGSKSGDGFMSELGDLNGRIEERFAAAMKRITEPVPVKVMLGNATVTEQMTFDPARVQDYFRDIAGGLDGWTVQEPTVTNNEDIRRVFVKFETMIGNYLLSGHISVQFHVLLYYKTDHRVIDAQKELSEAIDAATDRESDLAKRGDRFVLDRLRQYGYGDLDEKGLFEVLFENDELREKIYADVYESADADLQENMKKRQDLFNELNGLLVETYQTSPVMIDDARLVTGEEGFLCTFDLEFVKNGAREGLFDPRKMSDSVRQAIRDRLVKFERLV